MKATPSLISISVLGIALVIALGYAWVQRPTPPPVPAALAAAGSPAHQAVDGSPGTASSQGENADGLPARDDSSTSGKSFPVTVVTGIGPQTSTQDVSPGSSATGSTQDVSGTSGDAVDGPGIAPGSLPLPPVPASGQVPLAFRPLAPALAQSNPQLANGLQTLQQNFLNRLGAPSQNPKDPVYARQWNADQYESDQEYRILVGDQNYLMEQSSVAGQKR